EGTSAVAAAEPVLAALRALEDDLNSGPPDPVLAGIERPYAVNVGTVQVGDWPSSVPATAHLGVRVGFPRGWTVEQAEARVADAVRGSAGAHPWLRYHPPAVRPSGLRAEGYAVPATDPLVRALAEAHRSAHGSE